MAYTYSFDLQAPGRQSGIGLVLIFIVVIKELSVDGLYSLTAVRSQ